MYTDRVAAHVRESHELLLRRAGPDPGRRRRGRPRPDVAPLPGRAVRALPAPSRRFVAGRSAGGPAAAAGTAGVLARGAPADRRGERRCARAVQRPAARVAALDALRGVASARRAPSAAAWPGWRAGLAAARRGPRAGGRARLPHATRTCSAPRWRTARARRWPARYDGERQLRTRPRQRTWAIREAYPARPAPLRRAARGAADALARAGTSASARCRLLERMLDELPGLASRRRCCAWARSTSDAGDRYGGGRPLRPPRPRLSRRRPRSRRRGSGAGARCAAQAAARAAQDARCQRDLQQGRCSARRGPLRGGDAAAARARWPARRPAGRREIVRVRLSAR